MADSSFEERVREELEKLRLKPEEEVWTNVEAALQQERKRRWLIWFILFAGLFGAGAVYLLQADHVSQLPASPISSVRPKANERSETVKQQRDPVLKLNDRSAITSAIEGDTDPVNVGTGTKVKPYAKIKPGRGKQAEFVTNSTGTGRASEALVNKKSILPPGKNEQGIIEPVVKTEDKTVDADKNIAPVKTDSIRASDAEVRQETPMQAPADTTVTPVTENNNATSAAIKPIKQSKWSWQVFAEPGISGNRNGFSFNKSLAASAPNTAQSGGFTGGSSSVPPNRDAFSFSIGAQALHPAGKRSSFGISAGYALYRVQVGVGKRYDTLINFSSFNRSNSNGFVFQRSDTGFYANAYHFAMLNIDYYTHFKLGAKNLRWSIGLGGALLIASNAIHYDPSTGLLFRNNALIPDLQWNAGTGIDIALAKQRVFIGPRLTWFFTKNSTVATSARHLFNTGLHIGVSLDKKKK